MEHFTAKIITYIFIALILIGAIVAIWNAIPGIIKILAVVALVIGFFNLFK